MLIAIGENQGKVVFSFPRPTTEFVCDAENARNIAEQIARSAHKAHFGFLPEAQRSLVGENIRKRLKARAFLVIRSSIEQGKKADYIANEVTDMLLREVA